METEAIFLENAAWQISLSPIRDVGFGMKKTASNSEHLYRSPNCKFENAVEDFRAACKQLCPPFSALPARPV